MTTPVPVSSAAGADPQTKYTFRANGTGLGSLDTAEDRLMQWGLKDTFRVFRFTYDQKFQAYDNERFLLDLFNSEVVLDTLQVLTSVRGTWGSLGAAGQATKVVREEVACTATSMAFFDRLYDCGALRRDGSLVGCVPEYKEQYEFSQVMTKVILDEEFDDYEVFGQEERRELIFRLFMHLVYGGPLNQYEDSVGPYFDLTKGLYKDLVSVTKDKSSGQFVVHASAYNVSAVEGLGPLFPQAGLDHLQNHLYVVCNPLKRSVTLLYNAWCN